MAGFISFFLHFCVLGCVFDGSLAWSVDLPGRIEGMLGSCLVIPCSFDYTQYQTQRPDRVVWYQYQRLSYPVVFDDWNPQDVIPLFRDRTTVLASYRSCTLKIIKVMWGDDGQRLYPWVDPENIGRSNHRFDDKTVTIEVKDRAQNPDIMIIGDMKVGKSVTVKCSVYHTCSTNPPALSLNIPLRNDNIRNTNVGYGIKTTLTTTFVIQRDHQTVECTVRHPGGQTAKSSKSFDAQCSFSPLTISPTSYEFLEGIPSTVTCTASYTCSHNIPTLTWNYGGMPASSQTTKVTANGEISWKTVSILNFTSSAKDHGEALTCYAQFIGGNSQQTSINLRVKPSPDKPVMSTFPAEVDAGSIVTVSCSVSHTCSSHPPEFSWSVPNITSEVSDSLLSRGVWQRTSTITFMVAEGNGAQSLTCTAIFGREKQQASTATLTVKGTMMYRLKSYAPVVFPVTLLGLIFISLAAAFRVFIYRKREKKQYLYCDL